MQRRPTNRRERRGMLRVSKGAKAYLVREVAELALLVAVLAIVRSFTEIPPWLLVGLPVGKVLVSAGSYALFLRKVFLRPACAGAEELIGRIARASTPLRPDGQVKVDGEIWSARSADGQAIALKEDVRVVGVRGNTVLVARPPIEE